MIIRHFKLLFEPVRKHIPIYIASISPKSMEMLGEVADGWMPIYWPKSKFLDGKAAVEAGATKAGRPAGTIEVAASLTTVIESDPEKAKFRAGGPSS